MGISSINSGRTSSAQLGQSQTNALLASLEHQPTLFDYLAQDNSSSGSGDILDLSSAGQTAADQSSSLASSPQNWAQTFADQATASTEQDLAAALAKAGIDTSTEIDLQLDADGNVVVSNDNPQEQQIEDAINNNADLKTAVVQYLDFMQSLAPILQESSATPASAADQFQEILSALTAEKKDGERTITLALKGDRAQSVYQDVNSGDAFVLSSAVTS